MCRLLMNQLQFEFGINPSYINKDRKAEYIEALIATRESDDIDLFRNFICVGSNKSGQWEIIE